MAQPSLNINNTVFFSDFDFDFSAHPKTGDISILTNEAAIKNSIRNLVSTKFGEILFSANIGSGLNDSLFDLMDEITKYSMRMQIETCIKNFEPRVELKNITIQEDKMNQGYSVTIYYRIINTYVIEQVTVFLQKIR
jgi:phage baseplate assembly protein W